MNNPKRTKNSNNRNERAKEVPTQKDENSGRRTRLSVGKKLLFAVITTLVFFVSLEGLLGLFGWNSTNASDDPYVGFSANVPLFVKEKGTDGSPVFVTASNKLRWFNKQTFPVEKSKNTYRIFCLGGSTTYGHPYDDKTSFAGWLRELLPEIDASKNWEVINCGGISYASYRVANLMKELVNYEPDLFIIYTGHNEFLEARTYSQFKDSPSLVLQAGGLASRLRTFAAISQLVNSVRSKRNATSEQSGRAEVLDAEVNTLLDSSKGLDVYHRDDQLRARIFQHFEFNLSRMIAMAQSHAAKTMLITPASNLSQCEPFKSEHRLDLAGLELQHWQAAYAAAQELFKAENYAAAFAQCDRAVELDPLHAGSRYLRARILLALGESKRAEADFKRARDDDVCTLRAPEEIIEIVRKCAQEASVPLVDFVKWVEQNSVDGIPGDALFLDHVHGTLDAYRELALKLADSMKEMKIIKGDIEPGSKKLQAVTTRVMNRIDVVEHGKALRNISKVYSWAGKKEDADRAALRALELIPDDADTVYQAANAHVRMGNTDEGIRLYQRVAQLNPSYAASVHSSLGYAYGMKGDAAKCIENYQIALQLNPNRADTHYNLANIFEQRDMLPEAVEHYQQSLAINKHDYQAHYRLGLVYAMQKNWALARDQFMEASRLNPTALEPHIGLGRVLAVTGEKDLARAEFLWVLDRSPNNQEVRNAIQQLTAP